MTDFLQYVIGQVKNKSLTKAEAISLLRQFEGRISSNKGDLLHPLLHKNTSNLYEQRFSSTFEKQDYFIADYVVDGRHMLPGMACLEIARAAIVEAMGDGSDNTAKNNQLGICLKNVTWTNLGFIDEHPVVVHIGLSPENDDYISFEIYSELKDVEIAVIVYAQGSMVLSQKGDASYCDFSELRAKCNHRVITAEECYLACREMGVDYGPGYQCIEKIFVGESQVLAELSLPASASELEGSNAIGSHSYVLHPIMLEAATQTAISLISDCEEMIVTAKPIFPSSLDELQFFSPCPTSLWAWIKLRQNNRTDEKEPKFDIIISDDEGKVCVQMLGLTLRAFEDGDNLVSVTEPLLPALETTLKEDFELMTLREEWKEKPLMEESDAVVNTLLCFASEPEIQKKIVKAVEDQNPQVRVIFISKKVVNELEEDEIISQHNYVVNYSQRSSYDSAFLSVQKVVGKVDAILYLWGLEDPTCIKDVTGIVYSLQALEASKLSCKKYLLYGQWTADNGNLPAGNEALERCYLESWIGFERSLKQVLPETQLSAIYRSTSLIKQSDLGDIELCIQTLWKELKADVAQSVLYQADKRYVYQVTPCYLDDANISPVALRSNGTYLITGGCGGLGLLFAEHLAKNYSANLILTGRSTLDESKKEKLKKLEALGSQVEYIQADVSDQVSMAAGMEAAKARFGSIHGVIHAAGVENSQSVLEKETDIFNEVLSPKIAGTLVLDEILKHEPLDFICYFSSSSAILGDFGGCDYAVSNRFLMPYAQYRDQRVKQGECYGKSIVINWPLWREGGMGVESEDFTKMYLQSSGQRFLEADEGVAIFERLLQQEALQHLVVAGRPSRVKRFLGLEQPATPSVPAPEIATTGKGRRPEMKGFTLSQCIEWDLKELSCTLLKIPRDRLHIEDNLAEFGFDSILLAQYARALSAHYDIKVTPALFFGYPTLQQLTDYFHEQHADVLKAFYREADKISPVVEKIQKEPVAKGVFKRLRRAENRLSVVRTKEQGVGEPIAIIGMSGRFPQARTIDEMWTILVEGREAVTEIPSDRFDWKRYYGDPLEGKTNCKWSGSLPGVAEFDPLFFEISPREAISMDPRQRLLLQESWRALEDAGYGENQISSHKIGMFVGVETGDYGLLVARAGEESGGVTANHEGILAARLSYVLNLSGPNMAINTACSSGLVAAHQACLSLRARECDTAIAAGVNILFCPESYVAMSQAGMLSEDGKCYTFDHRANGMVPGEAVAVAVFKRLSQAEVEGDSIYAVIVGSAVNYDGKTNGITAPSGVAQTRLLKEVYDHYGIDPETIEYIVAHGTGTKLGDPVEINALYDAFKGYTQKQGYCALTSTKTNFGHTFAASGLVSLISLIESMRHEMIPASLHCEQENDYINWNDSPFYVNKVAKPWPAHENKPRLGAVSAFGMSGTNAHMVVRSYDQVSNRSIPEIEGPYYLLVLSAKTEEALQAKIDDMVTWLQQPEYARESLAAISYTLLEGRQHFKYRCAIVVQDREDAIYLWQKTGSKEKLPNLFQGNVSREFAGQKALQQYAQELLQNSHSMRKDKQRYQQTLYALADIYCQGYSLPWKTLFENSETYCVNLPTYPFARESYWTYLKETGSQERGKFTAQLHPLLHQNTSTLLEQRFSSTFTGEEFFLADHIVNGQRVLPGVAYLEMARAAFEFASNTSGGNHQVSIQLNNVVWTSPVVVGDQAKTVHIGLYPEENNHITYEVYSESTDPGVETVVHSQGRAALNSSNVAGVLDLNGLREQCGQGQFQAEQCYAAFRSMGLDYGPGFRGIEAVFVGDGQVLAKLLLPASVLGMEDDYILHPSLLDSALQASIGLVFNIQSGETQKAKPALPFALDELTIFHPCCPVMWAYIHYSRGSGPDKKLQRLDVNLCDEGGRICVQFKGFTSRVLEGNPDAQVNKVSRGTLMLQPYWREQSIDIVSSLSGSIDQENRGEHWVILCEPTEGLQAHIETRLVKAQCLSLQSEYVGVDERYQTYSARVLNQLQTILRGKTKIPVLVQIVISYGTSAEEGDKQLYAGLSGLLKTANLENPKLIGQLIEVEAGSTVDSIVERLVENSGVLTAERIRYRDGKRWVADWREVDSVSAQEESAVIPPWKEGGIYLITGGAGDLGLLFAEDIAKKAEGARTILTGRSTLSADKTERLKALQAVSADIDYRQMDIGDKQAVMDLIQSIQEEFGTLNGIVHSAGVIRDNFILNKTQKELQEVLKPKVSGLVNLDQATQGMDLDFLVVFSSMAGALGNVGQADYAAANAFMDAYAHYRNGLVAAGQRKGRTVSINWPLWKEGGMHMDAQSERVMEQNTGMVAMTSEVGFRAFYQAIAHGGDQWMVMEGDLNRMRLAVLKPLKQDTVSVQSTTTPIEKNRQSSPVPAIAEDILQEKAIGYFKKLLSSVIKLPSHRIEADAPLEQYGIDSIMVVQLTNQLEKTFGSLPKTLFFEYQNIEELSRYFLESYAEQLNALLGVGKDNEESTPEEKSSERESSFPDNGTHATQQPIISANGRRQRQCFAQSGTISQQSKTNGREDIAIIGLSGRYPQANTVEEFWINLRDGKDCITEIPEDRWDHSLYFDEDKNKPGKTYSKWGGFINGVDQFDPLFFNISPREAEFMDPQERLFLQCAIETIQDAGYTRDALSKGNGEGISGNVGVYVGVMYEEYQLYGAQETVQGRPIALGGSAATIANRVSYFCNFHGPSMALDTMCSSSLTAIHLACQSLYREECALAIAGGVNVSVHPNKYLMLGQGKFVSSKGHCESFGIGGDGYVPGEGVGAVLLKPLSQAASDGDHIYGVVKGTAVNHGGKTNGYSVPNPNAQSSIIDRALRESGINPRTLSYIEAHGTGTSLGDPIEIAGLTKAFKATTQDKQFCAIGSAKSNIGHCESAAGIAGVTKVLLQLRHKQLVPSLHSEVLNPNIDFETTPFVVQQTLVDWERPIVEIDGHKKEYPRIAGISSFGAGGSNAHVVIQEYISEEREQSVSSSQPSLIVLSAKNAARLMDSVQVLYRYLEEHPTVNRVDLAYTLQVGREAMEERLAMQVGSLEELVEKLKAYIDNKGHSSDIEDLYQGRVKQNKETLSVFSADKEFQETVDKWIQRGKYTKLLDLWVKGLDIDWIKLYSNSRPRRISLPTYPFAKDRYWVEVGNGEGKVEKGEFRHKLHPLLHQNTSTLSEQRFSSTFNRQDLFVDQQIEGESILPSMAYLEMVRAAAVEAADIEGDFSLQLNNITWVQPIVITEQACTVHIGLYPAEGSGSAETPPIDYEIYSASDIESDSTVHGQGQILINSITLAPVVDPNALREQCNQRQLSAEHCYNLLKILGLEYGETFRSVENIFMGETQGLAKLVLSDVAVESAHESVLHPILLEAALQATIVLQSELGGAPAQSVSASTLKELIVYHPLPTRLWAWIRFDESTLGKKETHIDIDLCDEAGKICVRMSRLTLQAIDKNAPMGLPARALPVTTNSQEAFELMTFEERWVAQPLASLLAQSTSGNSSVTTLLCFASLPETQKGITAFVLSKNPQARVIFISREKDVSSDSTLSPDYHIVDYEDRSRYDEVLLNIKSAAGTVDAVLYLWALETSECQQDVRGIVYALQALATANLVSKRVILAGQWLTSDPEGASTDNGVNACYLESWIGFERSLKMLFPDTPVAAIYRAVDPEQTSGMDISVWMQTLWTELQGNSLQSALYQADTRYVYRVVPRDLPTKESWKDAAEFDSSTVILRKGGTYLVTGGCGGLGLLFATHLAKTQSANLILTGRSALDENQQKKLQALEVLGSQVVYLQADVCDREAMRAGLANAKARFGNIHGILHAAGVEESKTLLDLTFDDFQRVLDPKTTGTLVLDELLHDEPLDFICYFSSSSAILGDFGSCNYAIGNRFQMAYAQYRHRLVQQGKRQGKTLVINWPLWKEGGMGVEAEAFTKMYLQSSGQRFLERDEGLAVFERLLGETAIQHLVVVGRPSRVQRFLGLTQSSQMPLESTETTSPTSISVQALGKGRRAEMKGFTIVQCIEWDLKELISRLLKIPRDQLHLEDNLAEFGFDSVSLAELARALSSHFDIGVTPAVFFGYPTLHLLTGYLYEHYTDMMEDFYRDEIVEPKVQTDQKMSIVEPRLKLRHVSRFSVKPSVGSSSVTHSSISAESIAIIGMSGRFPQARTVEEMWTILVEGKEAVTEIPPDRFDWQRYYGDPLEGKTNCKWMGCIPGVAEFDPLFFEISPREAISMDPRQRLLLQESWRALEDAGYGATQINTHRIGMFVGVETGDYGLLAAQSGEDSGGVTANHEGILAARLSYVLNLSGPNMAINTACSSGLVAAHQACLSLRAGECDTAIAAGVNILFRPESYIAMSQAGMLSEDGKCYTFDHRANGMVPGEAVAVVVFKRLSQAQAEGDSIYAVIAGSGVNYDGKTNGITAPSGVAQARLLKEVYDHYRIDPEAIEYIVAHGTGTKLGDPIEINALYDAFKGYTQKQGYCALTSTKTNFGHTFAASGLVSLISLVQAMRHEAIPPSLHCEQENDYINWSESPFYVNKVAKPWPAQENKPRLGAVSAFGMSGTNAHMVVRSYDGRPSDQTITEVEAPYYLLVLSAKTEEALQEKIDDMVAWLQSPEHVNKSLGSISYTLLEGRQHFKHRCAIVVQDPEDAIYVWKKVGGKEKLPNIFQSSVARGFIGRKSLQEYAQDLLKNSLVMRKNKVVYQDALFTLADMYCQGYDFSWKVFFEKREKLCINLPTYPFAKERYWISIVENGNVAASNLVGVENKDFFDEKHYARLLKMVVNDELTVDAVVEKMKSSANYK